MLWFILADVNEKDIFFPVNKKHHSFLQCSYNSIEPFIIMYQELMTYNDIHTCSDLIVYVVLKLNSINQISQLTSRSIVFFYDTDELFPKWQFRIDIIKHTQSLLVVLIRLSLVFGLFRFYKAIHPWHPFLAHTSKSWQPPLMKCRELSKLEAAYCLSQALSFNIFKFLYISFSYY